MAQMGKMEVQIEVKSPTGKLYDIFRRKAHLLPKICPHLIKDVKLVHGDWDTIGSVRLWTYVASKSETVKDIIEDIDEKNKTIVFNMLEGEIMKYYKSFKSTISIIDMGGKRFVKWRIEYEKQNDNIPHPHNYLDFLAIYTNTIDAYLLTYFP